MIPQNTLILASLERWSRTHTGGFLKAARDLAKAKRDLECVDKFTKLDKSSTILKHPDLRQRSFTRLQLVIQENLQTLKQTLSDFRSTEEYTRSFDPDLADFMREDLALRTAAVEDLEATSSTEILSQILVLISELDNFVSAKFAAKNFHTLPASMDDLKNSLRLSRCFFCVWRVSRTK